MITKETFLKEYAKPGSPIAFASPALVFIIMRKNPFIVNGGVAERNRLLHITQTA